MHLDVGHKWGSYSNFTLAFPTSVMFDSSMPLVRWLIGQVYLALGVGMSVHIEFLHDSNPPPCTNMKGLVCKGDIPTLLESGHDARRLKQYACICLVAGGPSARSSLKFHVDGVWASLMWQSDGCQILPWSSVQVPSLEYQSSEPCAHS